MDELISTKTRIRFREALTGTVLRQINQFFREADLSPDTEYVPPPDITGERRTLVEQYYAAINWRSPHSIRQVAKAYQGVIEHFRSIQSEVTNPEDVEKTIAPLLKTMRDDGFNFEDGCFVYTRPNVSLVTASSLVSLTESSILEHIQKARAKTESGDHAGAIASAYTLVEVFLNELLRQLGVPFNPDEGDIRKLYQLAADPLNLNPKGENLESYLKAILQGLKSQLSGLYELANKSSDRHARRYNPAAHHAKLAINVAFSLCEFLLDTYAYQQQRKNGKATVSA